MDLWIRSQDRRSLYKTSGFFIREEQYKRKGKYIIEGNECWLGAYNTFERALEVLNEIQDLFITKEAFKTEFTKDGLTMMNKQPSSVVYEMPEE